MSKELTVITIDPAVKLALEDRQLGEAAFLAAKKKVEADGWKPSKGWLTDRPSPRVSTN